MTGLILRLITWMNEQNVLPINIKLRNMYLKDSISSNYIVMKSGILGNWYIRNIYTISK